MTRLLSSQPDKLGLQVIILGFIRPEQNFDSLEALVDAIRCALLKCPEKCAITEFTALFYSRKDIEEGRKRGSEESWTKYRADPCFQ